MKMRKMMGFVMILALVLSSFAGCNGKQKPSSDVAEWVISVEGIENEAINFTSLDCEKIDLKEIEAILKKKDGSEKEQTWKGYGLKEVLDYLKAGEYSSVVIEAGDGYSKELTKELVASEGTILGIMVDGQLLEEDNNIQLVISEKASNWWVKGVGKIKIVK